MTSQETHGDVSRKKESETLILSVLMRRILEDKSCNTIDSYHTVEKYIKEEYR